MGVAISTMPIVCIYLNTLYSVLMVDPALQVMIDKLLP